MKFESVAFFQIFYFEPPYFEMKTPSTIQSAQFQNQSELDSKLKLWYDSFTELALAMV